MITYSGAIFLCACVYTVQEVPGPHSLQMGVAKLEQLREIKRSHTGPTGTLLHTLTSTAVAFVLGTQVSGKDSTHPGKSVLLHTGCACSIKDSTDRKQQWQKAALLGTGLAGFETSERKDCTVTCLSGAKGADLVGSPNSSQGRTESMVSLYQHQRHRQVSEGCSDSSIQVINQDTEAQDLNNPCH